MDILPRALEIILCDKRQTIAYWYTQKEINKKLEKYLIKALEAVFAYFLYINASPVLNSVKILFNLSHLTYYWKQNAFFRGYGFINFE